MRELLFFVLGLMIGGLTGITIMCMLQINRMSDNSLKIPKLKKDGVGCEKEK